MMADASITRRQAMQRIGVCVGALATRSAAALDGDAPARSTPLIEDFSADELDTERWVRTAHQDFQEEIVDISHGRLRVACSTIGTEDSTVKYHGVRTVEPVVRLDGSVRIEYTMDWNGQANGCYHHAGMFLSPHATDDPEGADDRIEFVYVGVPPGKKARGWATIRKAKSNERFLLTEDWPKQREGREIGRQRIEMTIDGGLLQIVENDEVILDSAELDMNWESAYLYLQQMSHSNYPLRTVFFDDVRVDCGLSGAAE